MTVSRRQTNPFLIAIGAAAALFAVAITWGTFAAGGSDSSCYLNQARLFRRGTTHIDQPLASRAPWPRAQWTFAPVGHVPSPVSPDFIVPICPPGLPLLMAAAGAVRGGEFVIVPLTGALAVWLTFVLGRRLDSARTGAAAALLLACSPVVLYQVVQPMTDVPAMAWWLLATVLAIGAREGHSRPVAAGLAAGMAVLTRPNLLPLAVCVAVHAAVSDQNVTQSVSAASAGLHPTAQKTRSGGPGWKACATFLLGLAPGLIVLAILHTQMYGSPLASGYGPAQNLFRIANIVPNLARYPRWLVAWHTPVVLLALAAPFVMRRRAEAWLGLTIVAAVFALYLPYYVFDDWWYIRFLLPALPWLVVLSVIAVDRMICRLVPAPAGLLFPVIVAGLAALWIAMAKHGRAFELVQLERHFVVAGHFAAERLPANAAVLTVRHSGSVHYYSGRPTISWDTLEPGSLDRTLAFLRDQGLTPILLLDTSEEPVFRARFEEASPIGRLDWPPIARVGRTIRVYDPADRARYFGHARNLSGDSPVQLPVWETSATRSVHFASSPSSPPSPSSR